MCCGSFAARKRRVARCRRTSCSATRRCATWPGGGRRRVERLLDVHGVGERKAADFGESFVECITTYCSQNGVATDVEPQLQVREPRATPSAGAVQSFSLFDAGMTVEEVAERLGKAVSTTYGYLEAYVRHRSVTDVSLWVARDEFERVEAAVSGVGANRLKPIYDALGGKIGYEQIRIVVACLANQAAAVQTS